MGVLASHNISATDLAFDRLTGLVQAEEIDLPNGSVLVPSDIPQFDRTMKSRLQEGKPVVVIYPDGSEQVIEPEEVRALSA